MRNWFLMCLVLICCSAFGEAAHATTRTVTSTEDSGSGSLRATIAAAVGGDTINFAVTGHIVLNTAELLIDKKLDIVGPGANILTISRSTDPTFSTEFRIFNITGVQVNISGLTISNGASPQGAGIRSIGTLALMNCAISGNNGTGVSQGGGIFNASSTTLQMENCTVSGNTADKGAGIYSTTNLVGAGTIMTSCTISGNAATVGGGGIYNFNGFTDIDNSTIAYNSAPPGAGSGIASYGDSGTLTRINGTIINSAGTGASDVDYVVNNTNSFDSDGYNLVGTGNATAKFNQTGDMLNADAGLEPLAFNGGQTKTHFLKANSLALDNNIKDNIPYDQRHHPRQITLFPKQAGAPGDGTDIGAVEVSDTATTSVVNTLNDVDDGVCDQFHCSLREAMTTHLPTNQADSIRFAPGLTGTITLNEALPEIVKVNLFGPGPKAITVARNAAAGTADFRIFTINSPYTCFISGLSLRNGRTRFGGAIYNLGQLHLENLEIDGNTALGHEFYSGASGGGICNQRQLFMLNCLVSNNHGSTGGGIASYAVSGGTVLTDIYTSTISGNNGGYGGGLAGDGIGLTDCTVTNNTAAGINDESGGGFLGTGVTMRNTIVANNNAPASGQDCSGSVTSAGFNLIEDAGGCTVTGNTTGNITGLSAKLGPLADNGGELKTYLPASDSPVIDRGMVDEETHFDARGGMRPEDVPGVANAAGGNGADIGAVEVQSATQSFVVNSLNDVNDGTCNATHCSLREAVILANTNPSIDTVSFANGLTGTITLTSALPFLKSNIAFNGPGANVIKVARSSAGATPTFNILDIRDFTTISVKGLTLSNGSSNYGGGIYNEGTLNLDGVALAGNHAAQQGGGIFNQNFLTVKNSTISGNTAPVAAGVATATALEIPVTFTNCTISGNDASGEVGGIDNFAGLLELKSCTIQGNTSGAAGAVQSNGDTETQTTVIDSIINSVSFPVGGTNSFLSKGTNIVVSGNATGAFNKAGDVTGFAAALGPLQDNGGPTQTMALVAGSIAINAGSASAPDKDQRGYARSGTADIGAFEFSGAPPAETTPPVVAVTTPAANAAVTTLASISGTATDNVAVATVTLRLKRNSDSKFWTGSAWGASTELTTVLAGPAANKTWSRTSNLPTGANLAFGTYSLTATASDTSSLTAVLVRNFSVTETVVPTITITAPVNNSTLKTLALAGGAAADDAGGSGINKVELTLKRVSDAKYWNGTMWAAAITQLPAGYSNGAWTKTTFPAPGANVDTQLQEGKYIIAATSVDKAANVSVPASTTFTIDRTVPATVTVINPPVGAKIKVLPKINGTATDNFAVAAVVLTYKRNSDNKFWTGTTWGAETEFATNVAGPLNNRVWSISTGLPSGADLPLGNYGVFVTAIDATGNRTTVPRSFNITETIPPSAAIVTPANATTVMSLAEITGTAVDTGGSDLQKVSLTLRRLSDNLFWSGSSWVATGFDLSTAMTTAGAGVTWKCLVLPKNANLIDGSYRIVATATDKAGNDSPSVVSLFVLKRTPATLFKPSKVQLSSTSATGSGTIQLVFTGALAGSATDAANYGVTLNGEPVEIVSVQQKAAGVVVISTDGLATYGKASVTYALSDPSGGSISGVANTTVK